ncbi:helix-turn-helix domain-containing protein [Acetivibrio saccincola]|uniref:helix-turn-helix domain-containing protein n=1 Tax=Acetivibrio saccincola TaxID=1677857 RepID=UPI002CBA5B99|nr:helix-turn-helix transcriptional regulator [Acetivibrio saccincola]HQD28155.1 helix-turn-helix transcriptional regulator [Acetivibrio saccincola]
MEIRVGELIKAKREEKKYSLADFAEIIGITPGYLSQIENGHKKNPKLEILLKIVKELDIDLSTLLGIENQEENSNFKIPPLLKLILAKERNTKVLEDKDTLKKICGIIDKSLECRYFIENEELYQMFLEDIYIQIETILKRYMDFQAIK